MTSSNDWHARMRDVQAAQLRSGEAAAGSATQRQEADAAELARLKSQLDQCSAETSQLQQSLRDAEVRVS